LNYETRKNALKINDLAQTGTSKKFGAERYRERTDYQYADQFLQTRMIRIRIWDRNTNANESDSRFGAAL